MTNSVASAPRSTTPPISGSGSPQALSDQALSDQTLSDQTLAAVCSEASAAPAFGFARCRGANMRSTSSSTSLTRGSSVITQFCPTVAETRPATCSALAPCRVTSKFASSLGKSRKPAIRATAARTSLSATRSKCWPVSAISSSATGTCQGAGRVCFSDLRSRMNKGLWAGKDDLAAQQGGILLGIEPSRSRARIARQPSRPGVDAGLKDIACERLLKVPLIRRSEGGAIGGLPAVKGFGKALHLLRHGEIAHAHFPQIGIEIAAKLVEKSLTKTAPGVGVAAEPAQQQHQVEHDQIEPTLYGVRYSVVGVKGRGSGLRHDRAIERADCAV